MNKPFILALTLLLLGCAADTAKQQPAVAVQSASVGSVIASVQCPAGDFRGQSVRATEEEALTAARTLIAEQIQSSIKSSQTYVQSQAISGDVSSEFLAKTVTETALGNTHDMRLMRIERGNNETGVVLCMSRADAAKGFVEKLRLLAGSLEFATNTVLKTKHPKIKSEAWQRAQPLQNEFVKLQMLVKGLDAAATASFEPVNETYAKARADYLDYCQSAKLYWNPEMESQYSEIAFSIFSKNLKMEKAPCAGNGISLVYKNGEPKCEFAGMHKCAYKPSILIASCGGEEYGLLGNQSVDSFQRAQEVAIEKLHEKLRGGVFWNEWEQEIKQWRPICE